MDAAFSWADKLYLIQVCCARTGGLLHPSEIQGWGRHRPLGRGRLANCGSLPQHLPPGLGLQNSPCSSEGSRPHGDSSWKGAPEASAPPGHQQQQQQQQQGHPRVFLPARGGVTGWAAEKGSSSPGVSVNLCHPRGLWPLSPPSRSWLLPGASVPSAAPGQRVGQTLS